MPDTQPAFKDQTCQDQTRAQDFLIRLALGLLLALSVVGLLLHGLPTSATFVRIFDNAGDRLVGPQHFRFILQPIMASIFAARDGYRDAKAGDSAFMQVLVSDPELRKVRVNEALVATSKIMLLSIVMDTVFQILVFKEFYPFEIVIVTLLLALLPYVILRGPFRRIAGWWLGVPAQDSK